MSYVRRASARLAVLAIIWTAILLLGGGFRIETALLTISARGWRNPLIISLLAAALAWALAPRGKRTRTFTADIQPFIAVVAAATDLLRRAARANARAIRFVSPWIPGALAVTLAAVVVTVGIVKGSFIAGGADSYGYVSQAYVWASGSLDVPEPRMREWNEALNPMVFAPLGWRPNATLDGIAPTYAPGFPMVQGLFIRLDGPNAVFYALPLFGGLAIWATYLLGRVVGGPLVGVSAALLVATSPTFLYQLTAAPMSDVAALAWWTLALVLATHERSSLVFAGGLCAALAILTRPNLAPLAIVPAALLASPILATRRLDRRALVRTAAFVGAVIPGGLAVAALNTYWYGSPTESGYGSLEGYFDWTYWSKNIAQWAEWLPDTQTPLVALAIAAPFVGKRLTPLPRAVFRPQAIAIMAALFVASVVASYLFYFPFDAWWYLRFLLPAYGALFVCVVAVVAAATRWLPVLAHRLITLSIVGLMAYHGVSVSRERWVTEWRGDQVYARVGRYVDQRLPENAVMLAVMQSGSLRLYSGRWTLRWDWVDATRMDDLIRLLRAAGQEPYLVLESYEVASFRERFKTTSYVDVLDHSPVAQTPNAATTIYAFDDAGQPPRRVTQIIEDDVEFCCSPLRYE
jgi:hypothetical protein